MAQSRLIRKKKKKTSAGVFGRVIPLAQKAVEAHKGTKKRKITALSPTRLREKETTLRLLKDKKRKKK